MHTTPEIKITGETATGKSALAFAIKTVLLSYGIDVVIEGAEDDKPGEIAKTWRKRLNRLRGDSP